MADRIPLIVNASAGQIQELGAVDPLVGITTVSMSGPITITDNTPSTNKTTGAVVVTGGVGTDGNLNNTGNTNSKTTGITVSTSTSISINNQGVSGTDKNLPPYIALAYMIRTI